MEVAVAHAGAGDFHIIAAGLRNINIFHRQGLSIPPHNRSPGLHNNRISK
jgi:hypothetical protein